MRSIVLTLATIFLSVSCIYGAEYYASPNGSGSGCTFSSPCSLSTALNNQRRMGPGDTLYLRGGTYSGKFVSNLDGGTVKSYCAKSGPCKPDDPEWAKLDGNYRSTIENALGPLETRLRIAGPFAPELGMVLRIGSEDIYVKGGSSLRYDIVRGWNGTTPVRHDPGSQFTMRGNTLTVNGSGTTYRDFEILDSNPVREYSGGSGYGGYLRGGEGIFNHCLECRFINLTIHNTADGIFDSETAKRTEIYGCIIFNNGHIAHDGAHGQGMYLQNVPGSTKNVNEVISFNNYGLGMKAYGANQGHANDFAITGYIGMNNGSPSFYPGNPTGLTTRRYGNLLIGSDVHPSSDIAISNAYLYHSPNQIIEIPGFSLGRTPAGGNRNLVVRDSIIAEPSLLLSLDKWTNVSVTGVTAFASRPAGGADQLLVMLRVPGGIVSIDNNSYYDLSEKGNCRGGSFRSPFQQTGKSGACGSFLRWADWQALGYDSNSTYSESAPTGQKVIVRENSYENGRNHVIVYNFAKAPSFQFTPKGLTLGQSYTIYDVQNWGTVYQSGTYNGGTITVNLSASAPVLPPIGSSYTPPTTQPDFAAFLLIPS